MSKRKRQRSSARSAAKSDQYFLNQVFNLPVINGPKRPSRAWRYLEQFSQFEDWILEGEPPSDADLADVPAEHKYMLDRWPDSFEVYRHSLWTYLESSLKLNPWTSTIQSLVRRMRDIDPHNFADFSDMARTGSSPYWQQRRNADSSQRMLGYIPTPKQKALHYLRTYADYYEIKYPLWILGVLARAYKDGFVRPSLFGGPGTTTPQASLINAVIEEAQGTPLAGLLATAYDADLRNAVSHNTHVVELTSSNAVVVRDTRSERSWDASDVFDALFSTQQFLNAVHTVFAYLHEVEEQERLDQHKDVGIANVAYGHTRDGGPFVAVFQLWCFHQIDPQGLWLDTSTFSIETGHPTLEIARFTENAWSVGAPLTSTELNDSLVDNGWVRVLRIPVAPDLGLGHPSFGNPDGARYEIIGKPDEHVIPYLGTKPHSGSWPEGVPIFQGSLP